MNETKFVPDNLKPLFAEAKRADIHALSAPAMPDQGAAPLVGTGELVGLGKREQRRKTLLLLARNFWHLMLDGYVPRDAWTTKELQKLLRRAGATVDDL